MGIGKMNIYWRVEPFENRPYVQPKELMARIAMQVTIPPSTGSSLAFRPMRFQSSRDPSTSHERSIRRRRFRCPDRSGRCYVLC